MDEIIKVCALFFVPILACKSSNSRLSNFIPKGYVVFEKYFGDLNGDGQEDCALIIKRRDETNIVVNEIGEKVDRNRRGIIVLLKKEKGYDLADKNYNCFSSENEHGGVYFPPELLFEIKNNKLYIYYLHGRYGHWKYTFRFQNSNVELIGYDISDSNGPIVNEVISINFLTKKKLRKENINENDEGGDEKFKETWSTIKIKNLIKLSEIEDFDLLGGQLLE